MIGQGSGHAISGVDRSGDPASAGGPGDVQRRLEQSQWTCRQSNPRRVYPTLPPLAHWGPIPGGEWLHPCRSVVWSSHVLSSLFSLPVIVSLMNSRLIMISKWDFFLISKMKRRQMYNSFHIMIIILQDPWHTNPSPSPRPGTPSCPLWHSWPPLLIQGLPVQQLNQLWVWMAIVRL